MQHSLPRANKASRGQTCLMYVAFDDKWCGVFLMEDAKAEGKPCQCCAPPGSVVSFSSSSFVLQELSLCLSPTPAFCLMSLQRPPFPSQVRATRELPASRGKNKSSTSPRRRAARSELNPCCKHSWLDSLLTKPSSFFLVYWMVIIMWLKVHTVSKLHRCLYNSYVLHFYIMQCSVYSYHVSFQGVGFFSLFTIQLDCDSERANMGL